MDKPFKLSHSFYKSLFEHVKEGFVLTNSSGLIISANKRFVELFGYDSEEELINKPIHIVVPTDKKEGHKELYNGYIKNSVARTMGSGRYLNGQRKDGSLFPVEVSLSPYIEKKEKYIIALVSDISTRKAIENEILQLNEELKGKVKHKDKEIERSFLLFSQIARKFPNGTINVFDHKLNYVFVDGQELFNMGIDVKKLIGTNYLQRLPQAIVGEIEAKLRRVFNGEDQTFEISFFSNHYQINAVPLPDEKGKIDRILVVERNITQEKLAEEEIKNALEKEKELNELKSRFVSMASHEFRTPLTSIYSSATLLEKYKKEDEQPRRDKHINRIKSSVSSLTGILNDILSLSKVEEGKIEANPTTIDCFNFGEELREEVQAISKRNQKVMYTHQGPRDFITDVKLLKNICLNLLTNAIKYSYEGGLIELTTEVKNDNLYITVKDNGIGIPVSEQENMFTRFFRAKNVTNIEGTGLGLNIVKKYVELLSGEISFKSIPEYGTTFYLTLPRLNNHTNTTI